MTPKETLKTLLPSERYAHSVRVAKEARKLAGHHKVDPEKAELAGLLHDCSRYLDRAGMLEMAKKIDLKISKTEEFEPKILHARLSAQIAKDKFDVSQPEILSAISRHTLGAEDMSLLDQVVYLADHIESERDYAEVEKIRELAYKNMDEAVLESTTSMISSLLAKGLPVSEDGIKTRNYYLMKTYEQKEHLGK